MKLIYKGETKIIILGTGEFMPGQEYTVSQKEATKLLKIKGFAISKKVKREAKNDRNR